MNKNDYLRQVAFDKKKHGKREIVSSVFNISCIWLISVLLYMLLSIGAISAVSFCTVIAVFVFVVGGWVWLAVDSVREIRIANKYLKKVS